MTLDSECSLMYWTKFHWWMLYCANVNLLFIYLYTNILGYVPPDTNLEDYELVFYILAFELMNEKGTFFGDFNVPRFNRDGCNEDGRSRILLGIIVSLNSNQYIAYALYI